MPAPPPAGDVPEMLPITACGFSHPGRQRDENEDAFGSFGDARLFIVADGMGGHNAGEVASVLAIDAVETFFREYHFNPRQPWPYPVDRSLSLAANLLRVGIKVANDRIRGVGVVRSHPRPHGLDHRRRWRSARPRSRSRTRATAAPTACGAASSRS